MLADGLLTYIGTPDLALEGNPLVRVFGLGWGALFVSNVVFFALLVWVVHYAFIKYKRPTIPCQTCKEYISMLFYKRPDKFIWFFYKLPKNWSPAFAQLGYCYGIAAPVARLILVIEWIMFLTNEQLWIQYNHFRSKIPYGKVDIFVAILLALFLLFYWIYKECKINKAQLDNCEAAINEQVPIPVAAQTTAAVTCNCGEGNQPGTEFCTSCCAPLSSENTTLEASPELDQTIMAPPPAKKSLIK